MSDTNLRRLLRLARRCHRRVRRRRRLFLLRPGRVPVGRRDLRRRPRLLAKRARLPSQLCRRRRILLSVRNRFLPCCFRRLC